MTAARHTASVVWGLLLLAAVGILALAPSEEPAEERSVRSYRPRGRAAPLELLRSLGFDARAWNGLPAELPRGRHVLLLNEPPQELSKGSPPGSQEGAQGPTRTRDPRHYRRFVEEGGILVVAPRVLVEGEAGATVPSTDGRMEAFLEETLLVEGLGDLERDEQPGETRLDQLRRSERVIDFPTGERIAVDLPQSAPFLLPDPRLGWRPLGVSAGGVVGLDGEPRPETTEVLRQDVGRGAVVLLSGDDFFWNTFIRDEQNAFFFVRLVEELAGSAGSVLFDDFVLTGWDPPTTLELAWLPRLRPLTVNVLLIVALVIWRALSRHEFARDPEPLERLSPLARARAAAGLLIAAGRTEWLSGLLRRGVVVRLSRRARVRPVRDEDQEPAEVEPREVERLLEALGWTRPGEEAAWKQALCGPRTGDALELERLGERLSVLERESRRGWNDPLAAERN